MSAKAPSSGPESVDVVERQRLDDAREKGIPWKKWGPYLSAVGKQAAFDKGAGAAKGTGA
jgi:hypothetical protein